MKSLAFVVGLVVCHATAGCRSIAAQPPVAELVGRSTISTGNLYRGSFTPDGDTLYFFRKTGEGEQYRIFSSARRGDDWAEPTPVSLGGAFSDTYPAVSPDGRRMVFASYRPAPDPARFPPQAYLWLVEREGARWGTPRFLTATNHPGHYHSQPRILADGSLAVAIQTGDYRGKTLYTAPATGDGFGPTDTLPAWTYWQRQVPEGQHLYDLTVSPDGSYAVLGLGARPAGSAGPQPPDIWVAARTGTGWSSAERLDATVNTAGSENFVFWSPDARELYFIRDFATLHRVRVDALPRVGSRRSNED